MPSALKYLTTMNNRSELFTRWYQELAGFNFTVLHKKGKANSNTDALSKSTHMAEVPPSQEDEYAKFNEVDNPVIRFEEGVNEIQHVQCSSGDNAKEHAENKVWSEVIQWVEEGCVPEKGETRVKS